MVTAASRETAQVFIDGTRYSTIGRVQRSLASTLPQQIRTEGISDESHPLASAVTWKDQRGGIGIDIMDESLDITRCWYSTCSLRHKGHIVLQRQVTNTANGVGGSVELMAELNNRLFAIFNATINEYDNSADSFTGRREMSAPATDSITVPLGGVNTLVIARSTGVDYSTDGINWSQNETDIKYLVYWRNLLFGMSAEGNFYFTSDLSAAWTQISTFKPYVGKVTDLFVGPDREGFDAIYAAAEDGLYFYDNVTETFVKTQLALPTHTNNGRGCIAWRNSIYFPAGLSIYRYTPGQVNSIDLVGPDRDDGIPETNQGEVRKLVTTHNDLIALVGPTATNTAAGARGFRGGTAGAQAHRGAFAGPQLTAAGSRFKGAVLGWNGIGWETKWQDENSLGAVQAAIVSTAYGVYRLWWAAGTEVYWMEIPTGITNPNRVTTTKFTSSGTWETPWFTADILNFDKTALSVHIDSVHPTSSETIDLSYALNYVETFSSIATKSATGDTEYFLPGTAGSSHEGVPFEAFKLKANLTRGDTTTNSPDIKALSLIYRKRVEPLYGFVFQVNMRDEAHGVTAKERRGLFEGLVGSKKLVKFSYVDDNATAQEFWVQVTSFTSLDGTGYDGSDLAQVSLTEVH